jgi:hypothetical protein
MSFSLDRILWSLGLLVLAGAAPAQDDPRALVKKAVKALGGEELLARRGASHTRLKGSFVGLGAAAAPGGVRVSGETWTQPGSQRMTLTIEVAGEKTTLVRALHDGKGWEQNLGTVKAMPADELAEAMESAHVERVLSLLPLLKDRSFTLKALGRTKVNGTELDGLKVSAAGYRDVTLYFDPATGHVRRAEYREKPKAQGKEVAVAGVFEDYRAIEPAAADERKLKAARAGTDEKALLKFLRGRVVGKAERDRVKRLVEQLGDESFAAREKATQELVRLGAAAVPEVRRAAKAGDAEMATRARRCLERIAAVAGPEGLLSAALAVVAVKKPAGAAEVLLTLASTLTDEADTRDLRNALAAVAIRDGKPDPAVVKALADIDPARKAAAAAALGKDGGAFEKQPGRRLFLRGLKRAMKTTYFQEGVKQLVLEVTEVELYNRFEDRVFARPK